jgi:hypothetical protein
MELMKEICEHRASLVAGCKPDRELLSFQAGQSPFVDKWQRFHSQIRSFHASLNLSGYLLPICAHSTKIVGFGKCQKIPTRIQRQASTIAGSICL